MGWCPCASFQVRVLGTHPCFTHSYAGQPPGCWSLFLLSCPKPGYLTPDVKPKVSNPRCQIPHVKPWMSNHVLQGQGLWGTLPTPLLIKSCRMPAGMQGMERARESRRPMSWAAMLHCTVQPRIVHPSSQRTGAGWCSAAPSTLCTTAIPASWRRPCGRPSRPLALLPRSDPSPWPHSSVCLVTEAIYLGIPQLVGPQREVRLLLLLCSACWAG